MDVSPMCLHSISKSFSSQVMFLSLFIFCGHSTQEPALTRLTILFCGPTQEPMLAIVNTGKNWERFWKKCRWIWTGRVEIGKEEIPGSRRSMYGYIVYWTTPGFKERTCKLCALTRWDFYSCVHSSPLQGRERNNNWYSGTQLDQSGYCKSPEDATLTDTAVAIIYPVPTLVNEDLVWKEDVVGTARIWGWELWPHWYSVRKIQVLPAVCLAMGYRVVEWKGLVGS